jgi:tryptophan-rich sensory protein
MRRDALIIGALAALLVAAIGATVTDLGPWYHALREPSWKPPDVAFGPIWTTILSLAVLSGVGAYCREQTRVGRQAIIGLFALNGSLNILWSLLFFRFQRPDWALIEVVPYWLSILALVVLTYRRSAVAGLLLVPYLAWVALAAALNFQVVALNGPFR